MYNYFYFFSGIRETNEISNTVFIAKEKNYFIFLIYVCCENFILFLFYFKIYYHDKYFHYIS